jgi:hypothetical protein
MQIRVADCVIDTDCIAFPRCIDNLCSRCAADFDCAGSLRPFCVATAACRNNKPCACVECRTNDDCPAFGQPAHQRVCTAEHVCRECGDDVDCPPPGFAEQFRVCREDGRCCVPEGEPCTTTSFCCTGLKCVESFTGQGFVRECRVSDCTPDGRPVPGGACTPAAAEQCCLKRCNSIGFCTI